MMRLAPDDFSCVIVNYNAGRFALDAALSFLGAGGRRAIIVDNQSTDGSRHFFTDVADARRAPDYNAPRVEPADRAVLFAPIASTNISIISEHDPLPPDARLVIITAEQNGGFAAGCNIGLRAVAASAGPYRAKAALLLNPDAVIAKGALEAFAARLEDPTVGLCGATVALFDDPQTLQAAGGAIISGPFHLGANIGEGASINKLPDQAEVEQKLDYPLGAAIAFRLNYVERFGYLDERYFLYFEELDWTLAGAHELRPGWAPDAVIYHRYGVSSGSEKRSLAEASARSPLSDFHMTRSRLLFAKKWRPRTASINRAAIGWQVIRRVLRGKPRNASALLKALAS